MKKVWITILSISSFLLLIPLANSLNKSYLAQQKMKDDQTLYDKIEGSGYISYMVIGDSIGRGSGASKSQNKWFKILERKMLNQHQIQMKGDQIVQSGATAFEGLFRLQTQKTDNLRKYDVIFIVFGENDRKYMSSDDFALLYEALIRAAKTKYPKAEIVTIVESSLTNQSFIDAIERLSRHYGTAKVNMADVYRKSGKTTEELTTDLVHPNDEGYKLYADEIYDHLINNTKLKKKIAALQPSLYENTDIQFDMFAEFKNQKGFFKENEYYVSNKKGSYMEFSLYGSVLGIKLLRAPDGGTVNVYIDGRHYTTISTWWPFQRERYVYIANTLAPGLHTVRFEVTGESSERNVSGQYVVRLSSIIMSKKIEDDGVLR